MAAAGDRWPRLCSACSRPQGEASSGTFTSRRFYAVPFGRSDPAFGHDLGFYVFTLPLLEDWRDLFMLILFLTAVVTGAIYWARGALDFRESPPRISRGARRAFLRVARGLLRRSAR